MARIHVLHENAQWVEPLRAAFAAQDLPFAEWFLDQGEVDFATPPPAGVFYNRMSASSHTRDHRFAAELTAAVLAWLERHGRRVVNGGRALDLEISKARQYAALEAADIRVPRTIVAVGRDAVVNAARRFGEGPVILKPNRGGKGLGVELFAHPDLLVAHLDSSDYIPPIDGTHLLQDYVRAPEPFITRAEFVGGRFLYAVRVSTAQGFELCPADACAVGDAFCPTVPGTAAAPARFQILDRIDPARRALFGRYEAFLAANRIEIAGIEFITDLSGEFLTYDVNTNTNYNAEAEAAAGLSGTATGMGAVAAFLGQALRRAGDASRARIAAF
ncbi:MAG: alpha-L-glutamate ligase [Alphaproteobacteria bacterium]|nr:alpha-L-glutamate ligase [Alphaproteobacteria bacterium]